MKVVRIIARLNVGGPAQHVVWLSERLRSRGFETVLIAGVVPPGEDDMAYFAEQRNVKPILIKELSRELSPKDLPSLIKIYRLLRRHKPEIIHTHTAKAGTVGRLAGFLYKWGTLSALVGRPRGVKVFHTFHGHVFHGYYGRAKSRLFVFIEKVLARIATDTIITISEQQRREINEVFRVGSAEKTVVIPLGVDIDHEPDPSMANKLRDIVSATEGEIVVAFVGRLTAIKNVQLLISAVARYIKNVKDYERQIKLAVIGDGNMRRELEELVSSLGIGGHVSFLGNRDDVRDLLTGADIVALSSKNEGTPLSLIEAMSLGRAVISTAVGGVVDLLGSELDTLDGFAICERGIAVHGEKSEDFANGLKLLVQDDAMRRELGEAGRQFVLSQHSIERLMDNIESLYRGRRPLNG